MHESKFVVRWSVQTFLQSNFHLLINQQVKKLISADSNFLFK